MKRRARDNRPYIRPVERIEVEQKHVILRIVLFVVLLVFGISAIIYALTSLFSYEGGWQVVEATAAADADCSGDFTLQYDVSSKSEYRALATLYGQASAKAYQLFHEMRRFDGVYNVAYLNENPNTTVEVDGVLYDALSKLDAAGSRQLFLAPLYVYYENLFLCTEDWEIEAYDPALNQELASLFAELLRFSNDPEAISLELQGSNQVCLRVSDDYLRFAEANDVYTFFGFHWMKNAFIADYLAQILTENGYTRGALSSYDGFVRNLDDRGTSYSLNLFDRVGNSIRHAGVLQYTGPMSIVSLRTFPVNPADNAHYYVLANGETRFPYLSAFDGLCRAAESNLVCYAEGEGCAELLLRMIPLYLTDNLEPASLLDLQGAEAVYCRNGVILHTAETLTLTAEEGYTIEKITGK